MALARNIATVSGATLISRVLGFARDAGIAALFGSSPFAQAFFALLQLINFFRRLLAEGAINGAFAPIWLRLRDGQNKFSRYVLMLTALASLLLTGIAIFLAPLLPRLIAPGFEDSLAALMFFYSLYALPYIAVAGPVAVIAAALNAEGRVGAVAIGTIAFNVVMLAAVATAYSALRDDSVLAGVWLSAGILVSGLAQLIIVAAAWLWRGERWSRSPIRVSKQTWQFFRRAAPNLISAGIPQLKLLAGAAVASSSAAGVSWLYYANRLYELPLGVASIAIAVVLVPLIAKSVHRRRGREIAAAQSRAFEIALGLALPAALAFAALAKPIAGALFERGFFLPNDTIAVAAALAAICGGLPGHVLEKVFAAISFAHEDTKTPMLAALCGLAAAAAGALPLFPYYGHVGVAAAIAVSGWVGAVILATILVRRRWLRLEKTAGPRLLRITAAAVVMALSLAAANELVAPYAGDGARRTAALVALIAFGLVIYLSAAQLFGVVRIADLAAAARRRL